MLFFLFVTVIKNSTKLIAEYGLNFKLIMIEIVDIETP